LFVFQERCEKNDHHQTRQTKALPPRTHPPKRTEREDGKDGDGDAERKLVEAGEAGQRLGDLRERVLVVAFVLF
jgi:hypothetical protein